VTKWATANAHPLLDNTTMVGGDPAEREPYGYVHSSVEKSIVMLRNPFVRPRTMKLKIDEENGFKKFEGLQEVTAVYPYFRVLSPGSTFGDTVTVDLQAYEEVVVETWPVVLPDTLMERPPAPAPQPVFSPPTLTSGADGLKVHANLEFAAGAPKVKLALLFEPDQEIKGIKADASDAGKPLEIFVENGGRGIWYWYWVDLGPGKHSIDLKIHSNAKGRLAAWLLTQRDLGDGHSGPVPRLNIERGTHLLLEETIR